MECKEVDGKLIITIPLNKTGTLSSTGKTHNYATSGGNVATTIQREGKVLKVGVNAFTVVPKAERVAVPA